MNDVPLVLAFVAGIVSFLSPCVFPLIPAFISYLAGNTFVSEKERKREIIINSLFFVAGFCLIFAIIGVLLNTLLESIAFDVQEWLSRVGGLIIIFFGLNVAGFLKINFLLREYRFTPSPAIKSRYLKSFVFGSSFAAGWTPCVGAILGAILGLSASQPGVAFGLLLSYALGFCIPFFLAGLFTAQISFLISRYSTLFKMVNLIFGLILVVIGVLVFTQTLARFANLEFIRGFLND